MQIYLWVINKTKNLKGQEQFSDKDGNTLKRNYYHLKTIDGSYHSVSRIEIPSYSLNDFFDRYKDNELVCYEKDGKYSLFLKDSKHSLLLGDSIKDPFEEASSHFPNEHFIEVYEVMPNSWMAAMAHQLDREEFVKNLKQ